MDSVIFLVLIALLYIWIIIQYKMGWFPRPFGQAQRTRGYNGRKSPKQKPKPRFTNSNFFRDYWGDVSSAWPRPRRNHYTVRGVPYNLREMQTNGKTSPFRPIRPIPSYPSPKPEGIDMRPLAPNKQEEGFVYHNNEFARRSFGAESDCVMDFGSNLRNWRESPSHPSNRPRPQPSRPQDHQYVQEDGLYDGEDHCRSNHAFQGYGEQHVCCRAANVEPISARVGGSANGITNQKIPSFLDAAALDKEVKRAIAEASKPVDGEGDNTEVTHSMGAPGVRNTTPKPCDDINCPRAPNDNTQDVDEDIDWC